MSTWFDDSDSLDGLHRDLTDCFYKTLPPGLGSALVQGLQTPVIPVNVPSPRTPTLAPPPVGGNILPSQATLPGLKDPYASLNVQMQREAQQNAPYAAHPDLGLEGDLIRSTVEGDFSKGTFENYWLSKGPRQLDDDEFNDIVNAATESKQAPTPVAVTSTDGKPLIRRQFNFYPNDTYKDSLGTASLFYSPDGRPVGFYDYYNFDNTPGKNRSLRAKLGISAMHILGPLHGATDFPIYYGEYAPPN